MPTCECGVVPIVRRLMNKGVPPFIAIAYMLAAPIVNPVVLASTYLAFRGSWTMVFARIVLAAVVATALGLYARWLLSVFGCPLKIGKKSKRGNGSWSPAALKQFVSSHIIMGKFFSRDLMERERLETINGRVLLVELTNGKLRINKSRLLLKDTEARNGVIHFIYPAITPDEWGTRQ